MSLKRRLIEDIQQAGPISVAAYMARALFDPTDGYYARGPTLGADFLTAPTTSQMFGEMIGLWCALEWEALGRPDPVRIVELGPGAGTLCADLWRASAALPAFRAALRLHLVEASAPLREMQRATLAATGADATWHETLAALEPAPTIVIGNEFLDCLPIRQFARVEGRWRERLIGADGETLRFGLSGESFAETLLPKFARSPPGDGPILCEIAPGLPDLVAELARAAAPGRALFIDYGGDGWGDTLQALSAHQKVDPLVAPGEADLTAHVDFGAVAAAAQDAGLDAYGPIPQGAFLRTLGLDQRAQALAAAHPQRAERIAREHARLTAPDQMGVLFQAICLTTRALPPPTGF